MVKMLQSTIENGTGRKAKLDRPAAGKTGTSQSLRDAWFIGFTTEIVAGVWFGNDNDSPMKNITGGTAPVMLWKDFMKKAHTGLIAKRLDNYPSIDEALIDRKKIDELITRSKKIRKKRNVFEQILENFF